MGVLGFELVADGSMAPDQRWVRCARRAPRDPDGNGLVLKETAGRPS